MQRPPHGERRSQDDQTFLLEDEKLAPEQNWMVVKSIAEFSPAHGCTGMRFIDQATIDRVITKAPDTQWKLIIALARYGGLRCPREVKALTWAGVEQWERLFQNLRASRQTELANEYPLHVVTNWLVASNKKPSGAASQVATFPTASEVRTVPPTGVEPVLPD